MHWHKKLQIVLLLWIIQCTRASGNKNGSFLGDFLTDDRELIQTELSKLLSTSFEMPMAEIYNRNEIQNTSTTKSVRISLLGYYLTGLHIVFQRLFSGKLMIRVTIDKAYYQEQVKALQLRQELYNRTMKRFRLHQSQTIKFTNQELDKKSVAKNSKTPNYPSSARPNYYDVMITEMEVYNGRKTDDVSNVDGSSDTDADSGI